HLGYSNNERGDKETPNRRNGYTKKTLKTTVGDVPIEVPRDREGTFEPVVVPKRKRDVSAIEDKVLAMYAKGMSQRDIADTIEDIYGIRNVTLADRKSTRLNSSHVSISYAVFCLKKKTHITV